MITHKEAPVIGGRYENARRRGQFVQVEAVQGEGNEGLVAIVFLKSKERLRTPRWLFAQTYRRSLVGPVESGAA